MPDMTPTSGSPTSDPAEKTPPLSDDAQHDAAWLGFGLLPAKSDHIYLLPPGMVAFDSDAERGASHDAATKLLQTMGVPPRLWCKQGGRMRQFFRIAEPSLAAVLARSVPEGVRFVAPGEPIDLPPSHEWQPVDGHAVDAAGLSVLSAAEVGQVARPLVEAQAFAPTSNPLLPFSLRGRSDEFTAKAIEATPLLGDLCLSGQVTVWYAAPNTGKTLIALNLLTDAVAERRIDPNKVYYINADDGSQGMATKMQLMDDLGVHSLTPGFLNFKPSDLAPRLHRMAEQDEASGVLVIVDTAKKFADLMDKKNSTAFGSACRAVAMHGGAVLSLAHTTKVPNADGTPRFAGTTDFVEDADAAYTIQLVNEDAGTAERTVEFRCFKRRGDNAQSAAYAYAGEEGITYPERLASVHPVDAVAIDEFKRVETERTDEELIQVIGGCILDGINVKMPLGREAGKRSGVSTRHAYRVIERYTGDDPARHRWSFSRQAHGKHVFELLPPGG